MSGQNNFTLTTAGTHLLASAAQNSIIFSSIGFYTYYESDVSNINNSWITNHTDAFSFSAIISSSSGVSIVNNVIGITGQVTNISLQSETTIRTLVLMANDGNSTDIPFAACKSASSSDSLFKFAAGTKIKFTYQLSLDASAVTNISAINNQLESYAQATTSSYGTVKLGTVANSYGSGQTDAITGDMLSQKVEMLNNSTAATNPDSYIQIGSERRDIPALNGSVADNPLVRIDAKIKETNYSTSPSTQSPITDCRTALEVSGGQSVNGLFDSAHTYTCQSNAPAFSCIGGAGFRRVETVNNVKEAKSTVYIAPERFDENHDAQIAGEWQCAFTNKANTCLGEWGNVHQTIINGDLTVKDAASGNSMQGSHGNVTVEGTLTFGKLNIDNSSSTNYPTGTMFIGYVTTGSTKTVLQPGDTFNVAPSLAANPRRLYSLKFDGTDVTFTSVNTNMTVRALSYIGSDNCGILVKIS